MNLHEVKNKTFIFKTYLFNSGLYYLARSLEEVLRKNNNKVIYFPKAKYKQDGTRFVKTFQEPEAAISDGLTHIEPTNEQID